MAKDTINVDGEERVVREDTAKSYRGVIWALLSILGFVIITSILFFVFFPWAVSDGDVTTPGQTEQRRQQPQQP